MTHQALEQLIQHTGASAGAILVEMEGELHVSASYGMEAPNKLAANDHVHRALRVESRQVVSIPDDVVVEGILANFRPREVLVDPLSSKHVPLGAMVLASTGVFSEEIGRGSIFSVKGCHWLSTTLSLTTDYRDLLQLTLSLGCPTGGLAWPDSTRNLGVPCGRLYRFKS